MVDGKVADGLGRLNMGVVDTFLDAIAFEQVVLRCATALELMYVRLVGAAADAAHDEGGRAGAMGQVITQLPAVLALFDKGEGVKVDSLN